ncbi:MAG: hypothetical protein ACI4UE_05700 [Candidatus Scatovivens sp.]
MERDISGDTQTEELNKIEQKIDVIKEQEKLKILLEILKKIGAG